MRTLLTGVALLVLAGSVVGQTPTTGKPVEMTAEEMKAAEEQLESHYRTTAITLGVVSLVAALLPVLVAVVRRHNNQIPIFLFAVFFGWTCIGWIIALIWAFSDNTRPSERRRYRR